MAFPLQHLASVLDGTHQFALLRLQQAGQVFSVQALAIANIQ
jgi:hypothetical protein